MRVLLVHPFDAYSGAQRVTATLADVFNDLGHGATSSGYFFTDLFRMQIDADKDTIELGFFPAFIYDYGLIAGALFLVFLSRVTRGPKKKCFGCYLFNAYFQCQFQYSNDVVCYYVWSSFWSFDWGKCCAKI